MVLILARALIFASSTTFSCWAAASGSGSGVGIDRSNRVSNRRRTSDTPITISGSAPINRILQSRVHSKTETAPQQEFLKMKAKQPTLVTSGHQLSICATERQDRLVWEYAAGCPYFPMPHGLWLHSEWNHAHIVWRAKAEHTIPPLPCIRLRCSVSHGTCHTPCPSIGEVCPSEPLRSEKTTEGLIQN